MRNEICPAFEKNNVPVVFCTDENYAKYFAVALQTLIDASDPENNYDVFLLQSGCAPETLELLSEMVKPHPNFSLRFIDAEETCARVAKDFFVSRHFTQAAYFRFFLPELLPHHEKVVYLDVDVAVAGDVAELSKTDIGENLLAGVKDPLLFLKPEWVGGTEGVLRGESYRIHLAVGSREIANYVNSGVLLFNLKQMRRERTMEKLIELAASEKLERHDQDALNIVCEGRIFPLSFAWNFAGHRMDFVENDAFFREEADLLKKMMRERTFKVVHYTGDKPWRTPFAKTYCASLWWRACAKTPFFVEIFAEAQEKTAAEQACRILRAGTIRRKYWRARFLSAIPFLSEAKRVHYRYKCESYARMLKKMRELYKSSMKYDRF